LTRERDERIAHPIIVFAEVSAEEKTSRHLRMEDEARTLGI
jgi:hypothetical protein